MPTNEPPTAAVMRKLQSLEELLLLLDQLKDADSVLKVARRIAGLAAEVATAAVSPDFARAVLAVAQMEAKE